MDERQTNGLFEYLMARQFGHSHGTLPHEVECLHTPGTDTSVRAVDATLYDANQEGSDVVVRHILTGQEIHRYRNAILSGKFRAYEL
jgi:hypothetical protein